MPVRCAACTGLMLLLAAALGAAQAPQWVMVTSPDFQVYSDGGAKAARGIAAQLERMRLVFHQLFPQVPLASAQPMEVVAVRNRKEFDALARPVGTLELSGLFQRTTFGDFILLRLETWPEAFPYATVYHEYTHYIFDRLPYPVPVWLNEGIAEFYQMTRIEGSSADLGRTDPHLLDLLRHSELMPLPVLFAVGPNSPYYHDQNKGTIFYAESWALVHYLMLQDFHQHTHLLSDYFTRLEADGTSTDPAAARGCRPTGGYNEPAARLRGEAPGKDRLCLGVAAAQAAFGNLDALMQQLRQYIGRQVYTYVNVRLRTKVDDKTFREAPLPASEALAIQADVLAKGGHEAEALRLLQPVLASAPIPAKAEAVRGYIAYRQHDAAGAQQWLSRAVQADPNNFMAQFLYVQASQQRNPLPSPQQAQALAAHLRTAIHLRPGFAPAYDLLAAIDSRLPGAAGEAIAMEAHAVALQPAQFAYRWNAATLQERLGNYQSALAILQAALPRADTPARVAQCQLWITELQTQLAAPPASSAPPTTAVGADAPPPPSIARATAAPTSPYIASSPPVPLPERIIKGTVEHEQCTSYLVLLDVVSGGRHLHLTSGRNMTWNADVMPGHKFDLCTDMTGRPVVLHVRGSVFSSVLALLPPPAGH